MPNAPTPSGRPQSNPSAWVTQATAPAPAPAPPPALQVAHQVATTTQPGQQSFTANVQLPQYKRPDGSMGTVGDGQAGDPQTPFGGSSYAGENPADLDTSYSKDFIYGRDPNYAQNMANSSLAGGNAYAQQFGTLADKAMASGQQAQGTAQGYADTLWNRGINNFAASAHETNQELGLANSIAGNDSAAQAQMRSGLNQSEASNLALARSGRGWGQSGAALGQAVSANAAAGQKATTDAALMRERQQEFAAGIYGQAAGQAQQAGLASVQQGLGSSQFGATTGLQAQQVAGSQLQAGAGEAFAGLNASKAFIDSQQQSDLTREQLAEQQYGIESGANTSAAQLQEQKDSRIGGYIGAGIGAVGGAAAGFFGGAGVGAVPGAIAGASGGYAAGSSVASDTDAKKDKAEAAGFAKGVQAVGQQLQQPGAAQPTVAQRAVRGALAGAAPWLSPNISSISGGVNIGRALAASRNQPGQAQSGAASGQAAGKASAREAAQATGSDSFAQYDKLRAQARRGPHGGAQGASDLHSLVEGGDIGSGTPLPMIDPSTVNPATSSDTWGTRSYGIQNPDSPESYLTPAQGGAAKLAPIGASQPWLDNYMAQQGSVTSDTEAKRSKERAAGFAEAMQQIDSNQGEFGGPPDETTHLAPAQEAAFQQWAKRSGIRDLDDPRSHYDYRGAYLAGMRPSANMHWPDTFKQHGHPTFSVESKYSAGPDDGGSWDGETYIPQRTAPRVDIGALDAAQRSQGGPVNDMRPAVGYTYQYKDPTMPGAKPGRVAGPMAQDLEHTIAADAVMDTPQGKMVNTPRLTMHNTSAIGEQQTEIEKLKAQLDALAGKKPAAAKPVARVPRASTVNPRTLTRVPTASYDDADGGYTEERVPITGEETNFKVPLGWNPDIDEAAAQQITFPGEERTHVVYRPGTY